MPKLYAFLTNDAASWPKSDMTNRDVLNFIVEHPDRYAFQSIEGRLTAKTFPNYVERVGGPVAILGGNHEWVSCTTWREIISSTVALMETAFAEGRVNPDAVANPSVGA